MQPATLPEAGPVAPACDAHTRRCLGTNWRGRRRQARLAARLGAQRALLGDAGEARPALDALGEATATAATLEAGGEAPGAEALLAIQVAAPAGPQPASLLLRGPDGSGLGAPAPFLSDPAGWVWALAILAAARLGRATAQEARLDVRQLQYERERHRALSRELMLRRKAWELEEVERTAAEAARRVEEEAARALEEARRQQEQQRKYQEEAAKEAARVRAEQEVKRAQYEAEQARLDAEYQARVEQEMRLIEEQRAKAAAEEEARRRAEEERRRQLEEERRQREEEERLAREAAIRAKLEERKRLEREKKRFALRLEGSAAAERPPKGTVLPGPLQKEAAVRLTLSAASLLGGPAAPLSEDYSKASDAEEALPALAGREARAAADAYASSLRLQSMTGEGPLAWMDEVELRHWMAVAATRAGAVALRGGGAALAAFPSTQAFQVRTEYGVLPADNPQRTTALLSQAIAHIEAGRPQQAKELLADMFEVATTELYADLSPLPAPLAAGPPFLGTALVLSHLLERALHERPARSSDAPAWFEAAAALIRECLQEAVAGAAPDSLQAPSALLSGVLGAEHPVAQAVAALAEANVSAGTKRARQERERLAKAELAAKLLEEEWPDEADIKAARMAEKEASTPIPERVWALRNVAGTLAMGGPNERGRARKLLEQAVLLKQQFAGAPDHPGVLPELAALLDLLQGTPEWGADAVGVAALIMAVLRRIADSYAAAGDHASATVVLESALRKYDEMLGVRHPAVNSALRRVEALRSGLSAEQRAAVAKHCSQPDEVLARLCDALTEPLMAYQGGAVAGPSRVEEWDGKGAALLGPFL